VVFFAFLIALVHVVCAALALPPTFGLGDTVGTLEQYLKNVFSEPDEPPPGGGEGEDTGEGESRLTDLERRIESEIPGVDDAYRSALPGRVQRSRQWRDVARKSEEDNELPEGLLTAVVAVESDGKPAAGSGAGARGLAQFTVGTGKEYGLDITDPKSDDPAKDQRLDPVRSIEAAGKYYKWLLARADGNVEAAHIMYNYGPGAYRKWLKDPNRKLPTETQGHLAKLRAVRAYMKENP